MKRVPQLFIVPRSGYANRLQAIASAALMAEELGADWHVVWEPQDVAPVEPDVVFHKDFVAERVLSVDELRESRGIDRSQAPLYLNLSADKKTLWLAGHDKGEQFFMPDLRDALRSTTVETVFIVAGGKFTLYGSRVLSPSQADSFMNKRRDFYSALKLHPSIDQAVSLEATKHPHFSAIHLRHSDRDRQAPWRHSTRRAVLALIERDQPDSVFVASDTKSARTNWLDYLTRRGATAWTTSPATMDRGSSSAAIGALIDWRLLGLSHSMVYFKESSFAEEAAVASGYWQRCVALPASRSRRVYVTAVEYSRALVTYPVRHGPLVRHRQSN